MIVKAKNGKVDCNHLLREVEKEKTQIQRRLKRRSTDVRILYYMFQMHDLDSLLKKCGCI